jgi:hypothetical protein
VAFGRKVDQIQVTLSWYATSVHSIPSEEKMNQYDFDSALKKYLSGQQTSEEEQPFQSMTWCQGFIFCLLKLAKRSNL